MSRADGLITRRLHVNGDRFWMALVFYFVAYSLSLLPWQLERITLLLLHLVLLGSFWRSGGSQLSSEPKKALISTSTVSIPKVLNGKFILRFIAAVFTRRNFLLYPPLFSHRSNGLEAHMSTFPQILMTVQSTCAPKSLLYSCLSISQTRNWWTFFKNFL